MIDGDGPLGGKREEAYTKTDDHTQAHMQRGAFSEEVQYIKEERNSYASSLFPPKGPSTAAIVVTDEESDD
jgi:hypothetical protein